MVGRRDTARPPAPADISYRRWAFETAPVLLVTLSLWAKLIYFSLLLRAGWLLREESVAQWIQAHPEIFSGTLASIFLILVLPVLLPSAHRFVMLLAIDLLVTGVIVVDMVHVSFYGDVPSVASLLNARMLPWVTSTIIPLLGPLHALYFLDIVAGGVVIPVYLRICHRHTWPALSMKRLSLGLLVSALVLAMPTLRIVLQDTSGLFAYSSLQRDVTAVIGLLPYHLLDAAIHLSGRRAIGDSDRQRAQHLINERRRANNDAELTGIASGKNVIVVMAESLQAFTIGLEVHGQPVTPRLSAFAKESLYFSNFYDQTYFGTTADGEFTSFQSLHPLPTGVVAAQYPRNDYRGLPAVLAEAGYSTMSAVAESATFWNMSQMHRALGFQRSYFLDSYNIRDRIGGWSPDDEFFSQTLPFIKREQRPFMAYLLTEGNHIPWRFPGRRRLLSLGELDGTLLGDYLESVHYFDRAFGEFIDRLRAEGLLDSSMIVLYADHQAYLGALPELARLLGFPEQSDYDFLMLKRRLPLIIRLPDGKAADVKRVNGGHLDVTPTVLGLLGITDKASVNLGRNLMRGEDSVVVFRDGSFVDGKHLLVNRFGPLSNAGCYEGPTGLRVDCGPLQEQRRRALEELEVSDIIIRGNLIPWLIGNARH
jgi:phosphoglycerol transferase MdoB-like AlkP superfamily enzyme